MCGIKDEVRLCCVRKSAKDGAPPIDTCHPLIFGWDMLCEMSQTNWRDVARELDKCKYLYLRWIGEPEELRLRLVVEEARIQERPVLAPAHLPELNELYETAKPIVSDQDCRQFEIIYTYPISYTVLNETYGKYPDAPEVFTGNLFREFSSSYLLEMTRKTTYVSDDHPGPLPLQHHSIVCLNHVIDVITTRVPEMRLLRQDQTVVN